MAPDAQPGRRGQRRRRACGLAGTLYPRGGHTSCGGSWSPWSCGCQPVPRLVAPARSRQAHPLQGEREAAGAKRLLRHDPAIRGASLASGTPRCLQPWKIFTRPYWDPCDAMPVAGVLTIPVPRAGTSRLARRLTTILPAMTLVEAIDTTRLHRIAGLTGNRTVVITTRPCRAPLHISRSDVPHPLRLIPVCRDDHRCAGLRMRSSFRNAMQ
jgi:hypothetical protein